jgi:hypothetical protein
MGRPWPWAWWFFAGANYWLTEGQGSSPARNGLDFKEDNCGELLKEGGEESQEAIRSLRFSWVGLPLAIKPLISV